MKTKTRNCSFNFNFNSTATAKKKKQEEIFAPILPVVTVESVDEAIALCGDRPNPLAAYVFQRDSAVCKKWLTEVASGGACVNDCVFHM